MFLLYSTSSRAAVTALLLAGSLGVARAQTTPAGSVGIGTTAPDASAALDVRSASQGLLVPRLDSASRVAIAAPATGLLVFQTSPRVGFYYYGGSSTGWLFLADKARGGDNLGSGVATTALNLQGNALVGSGASIGTAVGVGIRADGGLNLGQNTFYNNVYLGYQAGQATAGGGLNQFVGYQSGQSNTTGYRNQFTGFQSGLHNTTGSQNQFNGFQSGISNTTGSQNQFSGSQSGNSNTTGYQNQFSGFQSGYANTSGSGNQFSGYASGYFNTTGSNNQFSGYLSGLNNTTGSNNWAFGYQAGPTSGDLTNAGAIGYLAQVSQSNSLVLGGTGAYAVNVGIGVASPTAGLDVAGSARLRGLSTAGVVTTDASGNLSSLALSSLPGDNLGNGVATTALNLQGNALVGSGASIGTAVGVGIRADGGLNLGQNTFYNNVYLGYQAGQATAGGGLNQFVGYQSGQSNTTGYRNQFSGFQSGYANTTGSNNWAFGYQAGPTSGDLTNAGAIGYLAQVSQSNSLVLGGTGSYAVNVGIGVASPTAGLDVAGSARLRGLSTAGVVTTDASGNLSSLALSSLPGDNLGNHTATQNLNLATYQLVGNGGTQGLSLSSSGQVGIGVASPTARLDVAGNAQVSGKVLTPATGAANLLAAGYGNVYGTGTLYNGSNNVSVIHSANTGEYTLTFTGPLATADLSSVAVALTLFNGPGFVSFTSPGSAGKLLVRTYNPAGTLTDRGFAFVIFQP